jgi:hypothetical protein
MDPALAFLSAIAVGGTTLVLVGMALSATWFSGWYEERARRVEGAVRRGARLRRGHGAVYGVARPVDGRPGGLLVTTTRTQVRFQGAAWRDAGQVTTGSPFAVVLEEGEELEVDPREAVVEDEAPEIEAQRFSRDLVSRVSTGDEIWVTGVLHPRASQGAGAYRSGSSRARITAPRRGRVVVSFTSPVPRWRALAAAHKGGAVTAVVAGAVAHALVFSRYDLRMLRRIELDEAFAHPLWILGAFAVSWLAIGIAAISWWRRVSRARKALG